MMSLLRRLYRAVTLQGINLVSPGGSQVRYAATVLDQVKPGWHARVDLERLNLMSPTDCVLGQVFAAEGDPWWRFGYSVGKERLRPFPIYTPVFAAPHFQKHWIAEITARRREEIVHEAQDHRRRSVLSPVHVP